MMWKSSQFFGGLVFERVHDDFRPPVHPAIQAENAALARRVYREACRAFFAARPRERRDEVSWYEDGFPLTVGGTLMFNPGLGPIELGLR